jgi:hypothetical protein
MMTNTMSPEVIQLHSLLREYSFDVDDATTNAVIAGWLQEFDLIWVSHAITEALYQGRYKLVSVEHILALWQRRGNPIRHFNREFESIILGQSLMYYPDPPESEDRQALLPQGAVAGPPDSFPTLEEKPPVQPQPGPTLPVGLGAEPAWNPQEPTQPMVSTDAADPGATLEPTAGDLTTWFNSTLPVPNFQAVATVQTENLPYAGPIKPFVPKREASALHQRLKAVVQAGAH